MHAFTAGTGCLHRSALMAHYSPRTADRAAMSSPHATPDSSILCTPRRSLAERGMPMSFHERLIECTAADRQHLLEAPVIRRALAGDITQDLYLAFLTQAYHHVRCTVPLMMAVGSRLPEHLAWLQPDILHYLEEEQGHDVWILNDIEAAGGDRSAAARSTPDIATDAMVAYAYDMVMRRNPAGFFGMVHVLEGTSAALALAAADQIQQALALPNKAFTYLRSHGTLD